MKIKKLSDLLENLVEYEVFGSEDIEIQGITDKTKDIKAGFLFVAIKGQRIDAHDLIPSAIESGATVVVGEKDPENDWLDKITYVQVANARRALGLLASVWFDNPSQSLKIIGVTGTDGKTTTANLIFTILRTAGKKTGLISTINAQIGDKTYDTGFHVTNPETLLLNELLFKMKSESCEYVVLEVTSHGIDQERIAGIKFDSAVLTNITHEHLDYHGDFDNYKDTKLKLFNDINTAVLNADDGSYGYFRNKLTKKAKLISYSLNKKSDYKGENILIADYKMTFEINDETLVSLQSHLLGEYNAANILAAVAVTRQYGVSWDDIKNALLAIKPLSGRLEKIENSKDIQIYVDFAHTPNSLEKVLTLLKKQIKGLPAGRQGKLIVVFGCASERDNQKRPLMAKIATNIADISIFTAEDPRSENVAEIFEQMEKGIENKNAQYFKISERGEAINQAINKYAQSGDIIVITGKGHEKSMAYNGVEYPWSDQEAVDFALKGEVLKIQWKK